MQLVPSLFVLIALAFSACTSVETVPATAVVVAINSDVAGIVSLRANATNASGAQIGGSGTYPIGEGKGEFPLSITVVPPEGTSSGSFAVKVDGLDSASKLLVSVQARGTFMSGETRLINIWLASVCTNVECSKMQTCQYEVGPEVGKCGSILAPTSKAFAPGEEKDLFNFPKLGVPGAMPGMVDAAVPGDDASDSGRVVPDAETVTCVTQVGEACGSCGGKVTCDGSCSIATPGNHGEACGSCGGKVTCGGTCSIATPGNHGEACGSCGGQVTCGGTCSIATPGNHGAACGSCGGKVTCGGSCSIATPGNHGAACGSCGGQLMCDSSCSVGTPGNFGAACGTCGAGVVTCSGGCSKGQPDWFDTSCGSCGGTRNTCDPNACSKGTPADLNTVYPFVDVNEGFTCCWVDYKKTFGGPCDPGHEYAGAVVQRLGGGGGCYIVTEQDVFSCGVTVRFHNNGTDGATCRVLINQRRICD